MIIRKKNLPVIILPIILFSSQIYSFDTSKTASSHTIRNNHILYDYLPFSNKNSFINADKGFIAPLDNDGIIKNAENKIVWDLGKFNFIKDDVKSPDTVNPSLWRQSQLVVKSGLFKVSEGIYQVRSADLSNITFIEGMDGIIVVDPLISMETAKVSLELYYKHRPKKPIVGVIYTHSHVDHYGGVKGVVSEMDVLSGKVKIIAPTGFTESAVAENVMAGNVMSRRASYMYGNLLPESAEGQVGAGLGMTTSTGTVSLILPTDLISKNGQIIKLAGLDFIFHMAPNSEAPAEMFFYVPELKALCTAEDATHTLHNTYTLRGAKIRDPLAWSKYLNEVIYLWGDKTDVLFAPHHWPVWQQNEIVQHLKSQRDLYRYINDQTLHYANQGFTMAEIAEKVKLPAALDKEWSNRGYYGTVNHNVKATYVHYLGWFSGNPATLHPLAPVEASKNYVHYMGGAEQIIEKAQKDYDVGNYRWVAEVLNHVVFADPNNQKARNLEADALEQLGYQAESGPWRNFYLSGAKELREGVKDLPTPNTDSPDTIRAMNTGLFFDYMGVLLNGEKAADKRITLNFVFPDINKKYAVELENGTLHNIEGFQAANADSEITLDRETLNNIVLKKTNLNDAMTEGKIVIKGSQDKLTELLSLMDKFKFWFNIVTPN